MQLGFQLSQKKKSSFDATKILEFWEVLKTHLFKSTFTYSPAYWTVFKGSAAYFMSVRNLNLNLSYYTYVLLVSRWACLKPYKLSYNLGWMWRFLWHHLIIPMAALSPPPLPSTFTWWIYLKEETYLFIHYSSNWCFPLRLVIPSLAVNIFILYANIVEIIIFSSLW